MHSPCPVADTEQLDFFGTLLSRTTDASTINEEGAPSCVRLKSAAPELQLRPSIPETPPTYGLADILLTAFEDEDGESQLSLGLPALPLNDFQWSEREIFAVLDGLLCSALHLLKDERTTPSLRARLIAWVAAPALSKAQLRGAPTSFQACCLSAGLDFEEMREQTLQIVAPQLLQQLD